MPDTDGMINWDGEKLVAMEDEMFDMVEREVEGMGEEDVVHIAMKEKSFALVLCTLV